MTILGLLRYSLNGLYPQSSKLFLSIHFFTQKIKKYKNYEACSTNYDIICVGDRIKKNDKEEPVVVVQEV